MKTLKDLERKYDGRIPQDELNSVLGRVIPLHDIKAMSHARVAVTNTHRALNTAHYRRAWLDKHSDKYSESMWQTEDRRETERMTEARNRHESALAELAKLTVAK